MAPLPSPRQGRILMRCYIVMGVTGCGKSTVGSALAQTCGMTFVDGDDLHPPANIEKMASGVPLNDTDRAPWLNEVGQTLAGVRGPVVVGCSALKRKYRDMIRAGAAEPVTFIHLDAERKVFVERLNAREGHFMPPALLDSQIATLEPLQADETGQRIDIALPVEDVVASAAAYIKQTSGKP